MQSYDRIQWAEEAVRGIVSPKERQSARQELLDHIDDHCEVLMATGLHRSRALEQAVAAMGDPKAVGKHLRRVHQPILTCLLRVMRTVLILLPNTKNPTQLSKVKQLISPFSSSTGLRYHCSDHRHPVSVSYVPSTFSYSNSVLLKRQ